MSASAINNVQSGFPRPVLVTAKILEKTSPKLAAKFAMKIFTSPMKFKTPKRELKMEDNSRQHSVIVSSINKKINVYHYGDSPRKVLLVHGWSGRGTQLHSIAEKLLKHGYSTISFDAPAHGKSPGKKSDMTQFIAAIHELDKQFGPFHHAIGHSLGAMAVLNSVKYGLNVQKAVIIGSGDIIEDIMNDFSAKLGMNFATAKLMIKLFEKKYNTTVNSYSASIAAQDVKIPVLMFHDEEDMDVPVTAAANIYSQLKDAELIITHGLGHRKILGDSRVIKKIVEFLKMNDEQTIDNVDDNNADSV